MHQRRAKITKMHVKGSNGSHRRHADRADVLLPLCEHVALIGGVSRIPILVQRRLAKRSRRRTAGPPSAQPVCMSGGTSFTLGYKMLLEKLPQNTFRKASRKVSQRASRRKRQSPRATAAFRATICHDERHDASMITAW